MRTLQHEDRNWRTSDDTIPVGVLFAQSGHMSVTEVAHLKGTLLAIEEINANGGVGGKLLSPIVEEPGSSCQSYRDLAKKLVSRDSVPVIFGCCSSASRKAVLPVVERYGALLFYPSFYEGFEYSPNVVYAGATPNQMVLPLTDYLYRNVGRRFCLVGSDYVYAREINRILKEFLSESGGTVTAEIYVRQGASDREFGEVTQRLLEGSHDLVLSTVVGSDTPIFYETYGAMHGTTLRKPIASLTTSETEIANVSPAHRAGHITAASYFSSLDTPENVQFVKNYRKRFGDADIPCVYSETSYFQVYLFAQACAAANEITAAAIYRKLHSAAMLSPQGPVSIDPESNHLFHIPRIGKSKEDGLFDVVWTSGELVRPDPYLVAYDRKITATVTNNAERALDMAHG